jgi:hypothetical protein
MTIKIQAFHQFDGIPLSKNDEVQVVKGIKIKNP